MEFHVLYLSYDGLTDALGQSQILAYQRKIASETTRVTIISFEKKEAYAKLGEKTASICKQADINWQPLFYTKQPPVLSTAYDLYRAWQKIKEIHQFAPVDIVHCRGYISAILGEKMKHAFGTKFIFDMRGWWPDEKLESGFWSGKIYQPIFKYFKRKERDFFVHSDVTVSLTEAGKKEIVQLGFKTADKIKIVPTCTDLSLFKQNTVEETHAIKKQLGFPTDSVVLVYSGALGGNYPIEAIFLFVRSFLAISENHFCLILSKDTPEKGIELPARTVIKSVTYSEVGAHLAACDLGFIYYKNAFSNIGRCPTKLGEYWACGLPAISPAEVGDIELIFRQYAGSGKTVSSWTEVEISKCLKEIIAQPSNKKTLREAAIDFFSLEKGVDFYKQLYRKLLTDPVFLSKN